MQLEAGLLRNDARLAAERSSAISFECCVSGVFRQIDSRKEEGKLESAAHEQLTRCCKVQQKLFFAFELFVAFPMAAASVAVAPVTLVLIGKTGSGKSESGNSLLNCRAFKTACAPTSVTTTPCVATARVLVHSNERDIRVVDSPGIGDTGMDVKANERALGGAVALVPDAIHAFLVVIRADVRMTREEVEAIWNLQRQFSSNPRQMDRGVLLITHSDCLSSSSSSADCEQYLSQLRQIPDPVGAARSVHFTDLFPSRVVFWDNVSKDTSVHAKQKNELFDIVDAFTAPPYTDAEYVKAQRVLSDANVAKEQERARQMRQKQDDDAKHQAARKAQQQDVERMERERVQRDMETAKRLRERNEESKRAAAIDKQREDERLRHWTALHPHTMTHSISECSLRCNVCNVWHKERMQGHKCEPCDWRICQGCIARLRL